MISESVDPDEELVTELVQFVRRRPGETVSYGQLLRSLYDLGVHPDCTTTAIETALMEGRLYEPCEHQLAVVDGHPDVDV